MKDATKPTVLLIMELFPRFFLNRCSIDTEKELAYDKAK